MQRYTIQKIVRQNAQLIGRHIPGTMTYWAGFLFGALAVNPFIVFLSAAPFHVADTGPFNLFFSIALGTDLLVYISHIIPPLHLLLKIITFLTYIIYTKWYSFKKM